MASSQTQQDTTRNQLGWRGSYSVMYDYAVRMSEMAISLWILQYYAMILFSTKFLSAVFFNTFVLGKSMDLFDNKTNT